MIVFITSALSVLMLSVTCYRMYREISVPDPPKDRLPSVLLCAVTLTLGAGALTGSMSAGLMMSDVLPALAGMLVWESSLLEHRQIRPFAYALAASYIILFFLHIGVASSLIPIPADTTLLPVCLLFVFLASGCFVWGVCRRLRDVKSVMKTGTVWTNVTLAVEAVYLLMFQILSFSWISACLWCADRPGNWLLAFPILSGLMLASLGLRGADDNLFLIWRAQERRIIASMKVNKVETAVDPSCIEDIYQDIYERVVAYFETEKPFLDNGLTINDLSRVLYSNKLYISRAISQFTGRNFCQFVNYYRVTYSMELFRKNHELKIHELACGCGFNSDVSYNMAFRLFMGETPGEWCRKERNRKIKMKK